MWPTACSTASIRPTRSGSPPPGARWNGPSRRWRWAWRCAAWRGPPSTSPTACCRTWATSWPPAGWARRWTTPACPWPRRWTACRGPAPARHPGRRRRLPALLHRAGRAPRRVSRAALPRARHAHRPRHGAAGTHGAGCAGPAHGRAAARLRSLPDGLSRHPTGYRPTPCLPTTPIPHHARAQAGRLSHAGLGLPRSGRLIAFGLGSGLIRPASGTWGTVLAWLIWVAAAPAATDLMIGVFLALAFVWLLGL